MIHIPPLFLLYTNPQYDQVYPCIRFHLATISLDKKCDYSSYCLYFQKQTLNVQQKTGHISLYRNIGHFYSTTCLGL
ncbi:ORF994 [White spot syndrome virus]|uniref:ORF994 n=1 Tax=White spot syndrome virus TaxID=342409 RepID=A0A2D3I673_9VIRU|nr:ORF994 [White spot syndrome virus]